ncbi:hypothetical protein SAY86_011843 [Trapa natans]|uniref:Uncharacterized protein n=1 Tax=Trapa natans TaxID=22666 RepID=A0AAN7R6H9_TRANT|nr:hypothetical protein SAY86_011843 [Trapa natans]
MVIRGELLKAAIDEEDEVLKSLIDQKLQLMASKGWSLEAGVDEEEKFCVCTRDLVGVDGSLRMRWLLGLIMLPRRGYGPLPLV